MVTRKARKACHTCGEVKPVDAFSRNSTTGDGYRGSCKKCSYDSRDVDSRIHRLSVQTLNYSTIDSVFEDAACVGVDTEIFFEYDRVREAKLICSGCPAKYDCLRIFYTEPFGVFGGATATERSRRGNV